MNPHELVGLGSIVLDKIGFPARIIGPEEKIDLPTQGTSPFHEVIGGVTLNHLAWASLLGLKVGALGLDPEDHDAATLRQGMLKLGVSPLLAKGGSSSAVSYIFVDPQGQRAIYMSRGANAEVTAAHVRDTFAPDIQQAGLFSTEISQLPLSAVVAGLTLAKAAGATTAVDVDIPLEDALETLGTMEHFEQALSLADIIKPSDAAIANLVGGASTLQRAQALRDRYNARLVAITAGERGCALVDDTFSGIIPAPFLNRMLDSTGAGDAFFGGLMYGVARGITGERLGELANACGATCCEVVGAVPDSQSRFNEIQARVPNLQLSNQNVATLS